MALEKLVFIDESGAKTYMPRLYGRAKHGTRAVDSAPGVSWSTTTMIFAIRLDGQKASMVINGAIPTRKFLQFMLKTFYCLH